MEDPTEPALSPEEAAPKFKGNLNACTFGSKPIVLSIKAIQAEMSGVRRAKDIEHIHRMRVASRRLRAALTIFHDCLPAKKGLHWSQDVRNLTQALGAARDTDVQLCVVREIFNNTADKLTKPGLRRLLLRLKQKRKTLQEHILQTLEDLEKNDSMARISANFEPLLARQQNTFAPDAGLFHLANETITARLNEFLAYEVYIRRVEYKKELHAMRIAAKKLRYTLEIFDPIYPDQFTSALQAARKTQQMVGEIHDCDVWIEYIPRFLEKEMRRMQKFYGHSGPFRYLKSGLDYFLENRQKERDRLYQEFLTCWRKWRRQELWIKLNESILPAKQQ